MKDLRVFAATAAAVLVSLSLFLATGVLAQTPTPSPTPSPTPTPTQQEIFNAKVDRLEANAGSMPVPVNGAIESLTKTVTKTFTCPEGSPVTKVTVNITTTVKNWDPAEAVEDSIGTYCWDCQARISGGEKIYTCNNWVMLDPDMTAADEAKPPMGPIVDEGLAYHELLHGQLHINVINTEDWQADACKCNCRPPPPRVYESEIGPLEEGYLKARAGVDDVKVVEPPPHPAYQDGHFEIDLGPTEKELPGFWWQAPDPDSIDPSFNVEYIDVDLIDGHFWVEGKLIDETRKGKFGIRIDPPGEWIIGGLEHALVVLPFGGVGGVAELPDIAGPEAATSETTSTNYALWGGIAAGATAGAITLTAGAWYARRRWLG
jgi:hypothetical protein